MKVNDYGLCKDCIEKTRINLNCILDDLDDLAEFSVNSEEMGEAFFQFLWEMFDSLEFIKRRFREMSSEYEMI